MQFQSSSGLTSTYLQTVSLGGLNPHDLKTISSSPHVMRTSDGTNIFRVRWGAYAGAMPTALCLLSDNFLLNLLTIVVFSTSRAPPPFACRGKGNSRAPPGTPQSARGALEVENTTIVKKFNKKLTRFTLLGIPIL